MGNIHFIDLRMVADADGTINSAAAGGASPAAAHSSSAADGSGAGGSSGSSGPMGVVEQLSCSVVKTVEAHSKGGMSVLVAHPTAPLLATGTTSQVVKVWTDSGDVVSGCRLGCPVGGPSPTGLNMGMQSQSGHCL